MNAPKYQIFISSTFTDLEDERDLVVKAILEMGHIPVGMEMFSAGDEAQWQLIARTIEQIDYYLVIVAHRYGTIDEGTGLSYTEKEYGHAEALGIPTLGFVIDNGASWPADRMDDDPAKRELLGKFKERVRRKICSSWESGVDLAKNVALALPKQFVLTPRPGWVRASEAVTPQMASEMARLSQENAELRRRLAEGGGRADVVKAEWKSYFDCCADIRPLVDRMRVYASQSPQHHPGLLDLKAATGEKIEAAVGGAYKALRRLKLERNPVGPETMLKAQQIVANLRGRQPADLDALFAEVAAALAGASNDGPPPERS
jgi:hypothetical protein